MTPDGDSSDHGPTAATRPSERTTTRSACGSAAPWWWRRSRWRPARAALPQLDLGGGVERGRHVVGEQQLGVAGERAGQREALDLTAGQPYAAVADQGVAPPASATSRPSRASAIASSTSRSVVERDVVGERAGQHPRHLGHVGDPAGPQERLGVVDGAAVPARAPRADQAGERRERLDLPEPIWPSSSTSSPGRTVRSTPLAPIVPSSWTAVNPTSRSRSAVRPGRPARGGAG